jgi:hypothetical protein
MRFPAFGLFTVVLLSGATLAPRAAWSYGACCMGDNVCGDIDYSECPASGYWWGTGTTCDGIGATGQPGSACDLGACCQRSSPSAPDGRCDYTTTRECSHICGKWMGNTSTCSNFGGGTCASVFVGSPPLPSDCDQNGYVDVSELVQSIIRGLCDGVTGVCCVSGPGYQNCYYVSPNDCGAADVNRDGHVTIDEIIQGVNASLYCS